MPAEKLETLAPGRLSGRLRQSLRGHHPLFEPEQIRDAFDGPDVPMGVPEARAVEAALLAMASEPLAAARARIAGLDARSRRALVRLWFRLLDRAAEERPSVH